MKSEGKFLWTNRYCSVGFLYQAELLVQTEIRIRWEAEWREGGGTCELRELCPTVHMCSTTEVHFKHWLQFQTLASQSNINNNHAK